MSDSDRGGMGCLGPILGVVALFVILGMFNSGSGSSGSSSSSSSSSSYSSSGSSSSSSTGTVNGYSVDEYNADVDYLRGVLEAAKYYDHRLDDMEVSYDFTTQSQVDEWNECVESYEAAAAEYNSALASFKSKYNISGSTLEGDPDTITPPGYK